MIGPVHALAGYLVAYIVLRIFKSNAPRDGVFAATMGALPDADYFSPLPFGTPFGHHGVAHSPLILILASTPVLIKYRWRAVPYFLALMSHILTDFVDNTVPLLSPFSWGEFGLRFSLTPSTLPLAHLLQFLITVASAYAIAKGWRSFPVSLPEKYDKLVTPVLILLVPASPFLLWRVYDDLQFFLNPFTLPYLIVPITLILFSSILSLLIIMFNSRFLARRLLSFLHASG
ncbi:MAG: metal-dependent hydrolase [Thermoproteota archaeon]